MHEVLEREDKWDVDAEFQLPDLHGIIADADVVHDTVDAFIDQSPTQLTNPFIRFERQLDHLDINLAGLPTQGCGLFAVRTRTVETEDEVESHSSQVAGGGTPDATCRTGDEDTPFRRCRTHWNRPPIGGRS